MGRRFSAETTTRSRSENQRHCLEGTVAFCVPATENWQLTAKTNYRLLPPSLASCWALPGRSPQKSKINRSGKLPEKDPLHSLQAAPAAGVGLAARRILVCFVRYGFAPKLASSVRGSSRRITIMRFRPADIRVINRRTCLSLPPVLLAVFMLLEVLLSALPDRV